MPANIPADLVNALRCAAAAVPDYSATFIEAADEIERLRAGIDEHRRTVCNNPKAAGRGADEKLWALVTDDVGGGN